MKIAYPLLNGEFCKHFSHASHFQVINEQGMALELVKLPMKADSCSVNRTWLQLLKQAGVTRILVQLIGQRMLDRFLNAGFAVDQTAKNARTINSATLSATTELASGDGHVSAQFEKKQKEGNHCCNGDHQHCGNAGGCQH